mmetsp:Transcript_22541/g.57466  ORF Transcript_22541/g.57466 Transcript_22541/m.57466 type:complete len:231 (+) Transcript_22541:132-824(+)
MAASSHPRRNLRLHHPASLAQGELRVAVGDVLAAQHELQRCLERDARVRVVRHRSVGLVTRVLLIDKLGHVLEDVAKLCVGHQAVAEPVGHQLRGDSQGGAVLHEANVGQIRHFRAANAKVHPSHHVTQDALRVVPQLMVDLLLRERHLEQRRREDVLDLRRLAHGQLHLARGHVDAVVVDAVERGRRGRGHPGGACSRHGLRDLGFEHRLHAVRLGPHALTNLSLALES